MLIAFYLHFQICISDIINFLHKNLGLELALRINLEKLYNYIAQKMELLAVDCCSGDYEYMLKATTMRHDLLKLEALTCR